MVRDFNGTHAEYRALKRKAPTVSVGESTVATIPKAGETVTAAKPAATLSSTERNEIKKLEKEMSTLEQRKKQILGRFDAPDLGADEAGKLSTELGQVQENLDTKEMRWLELSEKG